MSIKNQFDKAKANILLEVSKNTRQVALDLHSKIQMKSPVYSSDLMKSWVLFEENSQSFIIASSAEYAYVLEYGLYPNPPKTGDKTENGYSKQAKEGFVRISVKEVSNEWK